MTPSSPKPSKATDRTAPTAGQSTTTTPICSLPIVGPTTIEDAVFYTAVGAVAVAELVSWPAAALIAGGHVLHQRARNVVRTGTVREAREGMIEALEEIT